MRFRFTHNTSATTSFIHADGTARRALFRRVNNGISHTDDVQMPGHAFTMPLVPLKASLFWPGHFIIFWRCAAFATEMPHSDARGDIEYAALIRIIFSRDAKILLIKWLSAHSPRTHDAMQMPRDFTHARQIKFSIFSTAMQFSGVDKRLRWHYDKGRFAYAYARWYVDICFDGW